MFDKYRLREVLVSYKRDFVQKQWPNEKYKWEAVKNFQDNWDVNAQDFADMLTRSLAKTYNLLASVNNFPAKMIQNFAKIAPEEVRAMFIELFDEGAEVYERIESFKMKSTTLLEKYGNGAGQHYQYENSISTYLWLRYPDKYYIYKLSEIKTVASELESDYTFKKGEYADNIRNFLKLYNEICAELHLDDELVNLLKAQLTDSFYPDTELRTLTIDEINRGNMSKIFGELLMLIERDYRGTKATLAYNGLSFTVPRNLYIIGMMNTADRSLAMIDYALRRRFSFFEIEPGFDTDGFVKYQNVLNNETFNELISRVKELNKEISLDKSLGKGFCIGHSYFCGRDTCSDEWMQSIVDYDILPMLSEYWFDESAKLQRWENILHGVFQ